MLKNSRMIMWTLVGGVLVLTALVYYQNRVIVQQSFEIRWLMAHCK